MFRVSRIDKQRSSTHRFGALFAAALIASFATTSVYAETEKSPCPSSQPITGSRIPTDKCDSEKGPQVLEVIMVGAVLEPDDATEAGTTDATPELPMIRANETKAASDVRR